MRKRLAFISLSFTVLLAGSACGNSSDGPTDAGVETSTDKTDKTGDAAADLQGLMLASAAKASEATTSRFEGTITVPNPAGQPFKMRLAGASDSSKPLLDMEMDLGGIPGLPAGGAVMNMILDGETLYMRLPEAMLAGADLGGRSWLRMDLDAASEMGGFDLKALLEQSKQADPSSYLAMLSGASDDIEEVGTAEIRGVATRHFTMTIDPAKAIANAPDGLREATQEMAAKFGAVKFPAEVWIAEDGLPRRVAYKIDLSEAALGPDAEALAGAGAIEATIDLFDFGAPVDVQVPSAGETADFSDLLGGGAPTS